jgi:glycosyltransferase involved in cell wall biosynthesis
MEVNPLVSFIVPYYNAGKTIKETINSIFTQSYANYDIWIVDDGSDDPDSIHALKEFASNDKITVLHQENAGPGIARNKGIKASKAKFIVPLDADDKIRPHSVEKAMELFFKDESVGVVYGGFERFGEQNKIIKLGVFDFQKQLIFNQMPITALIKKAVFETCGYYDEFLSKPGLEDWEFWIRVGKSKWKIVKTDFIFFDVRYHNSSRTFQVADKNLPIVREHVVSKHAGLYYKYYEKLYYEKKMLKETPDYKIGNIIMAPYRFIKRFFKSRNQ